MGTRSDDLSASQGRPVAMAQGTGPAQWLAEHAAEGPPVFLGEEIPAATLAALDRASMVSRTPGRVLVIHSPMDDPESVKKALFWAIVQKTAERYAPAVVERDSALRLYVGSTTPGSEVRIRHTGQSRWRQDVLPGVSLRLVHGPVDAVAHVNVGEARIPIETPERLLLSLPLNFLRDPTDLVRLLVWLKSLVVARPALLEAYRAFPRPVVLKRIANLGRDVGNERLADLLDDVVATEQAVRISRARTGAGTTFVVPPQIAQLRSTRSPWLDRLRLLIQDSIAQTRRVLGGAQAPASRYDLAALLESAREGKAYDAYHSSSIEGYRLRLDEVSAFLAGSTDAGPGIENLKARLAVVGYGDAFDALLARLADQGGAIPLTPGLALDLYTDLFTPSIEAGLVESTALRRFREGPVFIRDTLYTPPNADKVPGMLDLLFDEIDALPADEGYLKATLVHLWFVWIHPFPDGNGRVARFLMNTALLADRRRWLTIRVEQRGPYFAAIKHAQTNEDSVPFARFIRGCIEESGRIT